MRLVSIEGEFEEKCVWNVRLLAEQDSLHSALSAANVRQRQQEEQMAAAKEECRNRIQQLVSDLEALRAAYEALRAAHEALRSRWPLRAARSLRSIKRRLWN